MLSSMAKLEYLLLWAPLVETRIDSIRLLKSQRLLHFLQRWRSWLSSFLEPSLDIPYSCLSLSSDMIVMESHQAGKLDTSGTAKAIISYFQKLGVSFDMDQIQMLWDPKQQIKMVGVPEEHLSGHAFHLYHLTSPHQTY
ncbi:hypothetical protein GOBAR_DD17700 [Gossypium barbadense]|nr:hypothetical protein GOBAR_DD17700 [Gossypium barbadense]